MYILSAELYRYIQYMFLKEDEYLVSIQEERLTVKSIFPKHMKTLVVGA